MTDTATAPAAVPAAFAAPDPAHLARELARAEADLAALDRRDRDYRRQAGPLERTVELCQPLPTADEADLLRRTEAAVGSRAAYVEAKLQERWRKAHDADPAGTGTLEAWRARVAAAYVPQLQTAWAGDYQDRYWSLRREHVRAAREAAARQAAAGWPLRPHAADLVTIGLWPPAGWYQSRPLFVLLPLSAPGAAELCRQLGLGEDEVPDFSEPYWASRLGYGGNPSRLPRGKALVLGTTMDPLGDGPELPPSFEPATAATWTRELARRPPTMDELKVRAEAERRARADAEAAGRERDREAEKRRQEEARLRANPLRRIADLEARLRDLTGRLGDAEAVARAEQLRRELDELLARKRGNGHG
jgi:hypothetical protein